MSENQSELFSITQLSQEFQISTRTIRFYETKELIAPTRVGSTRVFSRRDRARLMLVLRGKRLGFSLSEIAEYLRLHDADPHQINQNEHLITKVQERLENLRQQRKDLDATIAELEDIKRLAHQNLKEKKIA